MTRDRSKVRVILHVDMDAFFAAVEQHDQPELRGKPVVIGADPQGGSGRGVVSTASYEARVFGIHSAMPISKAYRLCPNAVFLRGRFERYAQVSGQVMQILKSFTPQIQQISIDEAFADLTADMGHYESRVSLGHQIKSRIKQDTGLTASIGIAPNKFIAKIASDLQKPDGLTICEPHAEKTFLAPLPISKLWGVGKKSEEKLHRLGFHTIGDLANADANLLIKKIGSWGYTLWKLSNGIDNRPVVEGGVRKSISEETTFNEDVDDSEYLEKRLYKIADRLARSMRSKELKGRTVTLKIRLTGFETFTRSRTLPDFIDDAESLRSVAISLFRAFDRGDKAVRLVGIGVSQLNTLGGEQLSLFSTTEHDGRTSQVDALLDDLKSRFGTDAVTRGTFLGRSGRPPSSAEPEDETPN